MLPHGADLGVEGAVGVNGPFGRAGTSRGEQDGGRIVGPGPGHDMGDPGILADLVQGQPPPEPALPHGDPCFNRGEELGKKGPDHMGQGDADERFGAAFLETAHHPPDAHARIHHHRHRTGLEHGKGQGEKFQARSDHENGSGPLADSRGRQAVGQAVGFMVHLLESQVAVSHPARLVPAHRGDHGPLVGMAPDHLFEMGGDVDDPSPRVGRGTAKSVICLGHENTGQWGAV